jgi:hypothetical protein
MRRSSSFWGAVEQVLREAGAPLHVKDITQSIEGGGLWRSSGRTPVATVTARLAREVKVNGHSSRFRRAAPNTFELNPPVVEASQLTARVSQRPSNMTEPATSQPRIGVRRRLSFTDAAEVVLWRFGNRRPMHYRDITKLMLAEQLVQTKGKTPEATLYARIIDENAAAHKRGRRPRFERHGKGLVSLTAWLSPGAQGEVAHAAGLTSTSSPRDAAFALEPRTASLVETMLQAAGWAVSRAHDPSSGQSVAVSNFRVGGRILDYALLAGRRMLGFVEIKAHPEPVELLEQQARSLAHEAELPASEEVGQYPGFIYLVNGTETFFLKDGGDAPRREVAGFHRPHTLLRWADEPPFPEQVARMPPIEFDRLRAHQINALVALESSLASGDRRCLLEMVAGAGSLAITAAETYRLLRHTATRRILLVVDSGVSAYQARRALLDFKTPDGCLGDLYSVALVNSSDFPMDADVLILTIQKLHRMMSKTESAFERDGADQAPSVIADRQDPPVDFFDFIWCQESRSLVASASGRLLDHFDAPIVGFASTPSREAAAYFDGNVVMKLDPRTLFELADRERSAGEWIRAAPPEDLPTPAPFLLDFLQRYLYDRRATELVDPAVSNPVLPAAILDVNAARHATGFLTSADLANLARDSYSDPRIDWVQQSLLNAGAEDFSLIGTPDLIVSFPPLGMPSEAISISAPEGRSIALDDNAGYVLLLRTAAQLAPGGEAIFVVGDDFFLRNRPAGARALLGALGLHVHAAIAVERGITGLAVPVNLIFIGHTDPATTFVGKLSPQVDTDQLVSHLKRRRRGAVPELGRLVEWESFQGYAQLAIEERVAVLIADTDLDAVSLVEILAEPVQAPPRPGGDFSSRENAVYLSRFTSGPVHTRREQLTGELRNYYQLVLDPRYALAEYVALTFTTPLGRALREALAPSKNRASISLKALSQLQLPLPELQVQREVSRAHGHIGGLRLELDGLERRLASNPRSVSQVAKALEGIGQRDPLTTFLETMPFPLASILWRYEADADVAAKIDHLHRFFEAGAIYFTAVLLSAFCSERELFDEERRHWLKRLRPNSFRRSSFGTWTFFGGQLADSARLRLEGDEDSRNEMRSAFALDARRFVDAVSSSGLWRLLDEARQERNRSRAHGGILGRSEQEDIHVLLGNLLTQLGGMLSEPLAEVRLVRPGAARFRGGVGHYERAELLQGPHTIFQQAQLSAFPQMDADELYLVPAGSETARNVLRIAPLLRLQTSPRSAENACYFYNGLTADNEAEFISHHFEAQPRITLCAPDLIELLARLREPER